LIHPKKRKNETCLASNNKTKSKNFNSNSATIEIVSLEDIGCYEEILETADTIEGNSVLKELCNRKVHGYDCFADDRT
jgi:XTP/dITP diphosphohydrolase